MPRIYGISNPKSGKIKVFYTVDQSVGKVKKPNPIPLASSVTRPMKIDGIWGSGSQAYLDAWESMISRAVGGVLTDGKVSSMTSGTTGGSITGARFKMAVLNGHYGLYRNNDWHLPLTKDPLWPAELTKTLFIETTI